MEHAIYFDDLLLLVVLYLIYYTYIIVKNRINHSNKSDVKKCFLNRSNQKLKIGLFTNEIPPIVYGGVATWILNFMEMFREDENYDVFYENYPWPKYYGFDRMNTKKKLEEIKLNSQKSHYLAKRLCMYSMSPCTNEKISNYLNYKKIYNYRVYYFQNAYN